MSNVDHRDSLIPWNVRPDNIELWAEELDLIENPHKNEGSLHRKKINSSSANINKNKGESNE
tara:strand:- start:139 stop:324 length:186 start_codon:yes stop_codon:yes gene_type:complete